MSNTVLSLDLASTLGWALIKDGVIEFSGEADFSLNGRREGQNLLDFQNWLEDNFDGVDEVFYEKIGFMRHRNNSLQTDFRAILRIFLCKYNLRSYCLTPEQWRKTLTGKARGTEKGREKFRMCSYIHAMGWKGGKIGTDKRNNECDAIGLAFAIMRIRGIDLQFKRLDY